MTNDDAEAIELLFAEDGTLDSDAVVRVQQILATETASISVDGFAERTKDDRDEVRRHLQQLEERGLLEEYDEVYSVTDEAIAELKQANQYEQVGILYDMYEAAKDG